MRFEQLTQRFQQALQDAQSLAMRNDNGYLEAVHVLKVLLDDFDGGRCAIAAKLGCEAFGGNEPVFGREWQQHSLARPCQYGAVDGVDVTGHRLQYARLHHANRHRRVVVTGR